VPLNHLRLSAVLLLLCEMLGRDVLPTRIVTNPSVVVSCIILTWMFGFPILTVSLCPYLCSGLVLSTYRIMTFAVPAGSGVLLFSTAFTNAGALA
jgi:hypothetical protein